jgi:hypothetical protein
MMSIHSLTCGEELEFIVPMRVTAVGWDARRNRLRLFVERLDNAPALESDIQRVKRTRRISPIDRRRRRAGPNGLLA